MIIRKFTVNINDSSTKLSQSIVLYKGDSGLLLNITLQNFKFNVSSIGKIDASIVNLSTAKLTVLEGLRHENDIITLPIGEGGLVLDCAGTYRVQLHIYDSNLNRISVPTFNILCEENISS